MQDNRTFCIVTPSVRNFDYNFMFGALKGQSYTHIIVEDGGDRMDRSGLEDARVVLATEKFVIDYLGGQRDSQLFPLRNPSCKNFGLWWAYQGGYDVIVLLDDDVRVQSNHLSSTPVGRQIAAAKSYTQSGWYNPLAQLSNGIYGQLNLYARGYPYEYREELLGFSTESFRCTPVLNEGLWTRTPDINGIDKAKLNPDYIRSITKDGVNDEGKEWWILPGTRPKPEYVVLEQGQKLPLSIMNVQLDRRVVPAFYQPPDYHMGTFRVRRHDDVWSMGFLKVIADSFGDVVTVGWPMVEHMKSSDPVGEIISEHPTNLIQPYLFRLFSDVEQLLAKDNITTTYAERAAYAAGYMLFRANNDTVYPGWVKTILTDYARGASRWAMKFM